MSQKKMEAYKEAKKNVKKIRKAEKRNKFLAGFGVFLALALFIAGSVFLIYYTEVIKPAQEKAAGEAAAAEVTDLANSDNIVDVVNNAMENTDATDGAAAESAEGAETEVAVPADDAAAETADDAASVDAEGAEAAPAE